MVDLHLAALVKIVLIDEKSEIKVFADNGKIIGNWMNFKSFQTQV